MFRFPIAGLEGLVNRFARFGLTLRFHCGAANPDAEIWRQLHDSVREHLSQNKIHMPGMNTGDCSSVSDLPWRLLAPGNKNKGGTCQFNTMEPLNSTFTPMSLFKVCKGSDVSFQYLRGLVTKEVIMMISALQLLGFMLTSDELRRSQKWQPTGSHFQCDWRHAR